MKTISTFIFIFLLPILLTEKTKIIDFSKTKNNFPNPIRTVLSEDYHYNTKYNDISNTNSSILIKVKLEDNNATIIIGEELTDKETGTKILPTIAFITDYDDTFNNFFDISDIEENTHFEIQLKDNDQSFTDTAECRLWKPKE